MPESCGGEAGNQLDRQSSVTRTRLYPGIVSLLCFFVFYVLVTQETHAAVQRNSCQGHPLARLPAGTSSPHAAFHFTLVPRLRDFCSDKWGSKVERGRPLTTHLRGRQRLKLRKLLKLEASSLQPQNTIAENAEDEAQRWQKLQEWADEQGIKRSGWDVGDVGGGLRGVIATKNIKKGDTITSIPTESAFLVQKGCSCPLPSTFVDAEYWDSRGAKWEAQMALLLLYEKHLGDKSEFAAYIDMLPRSFSLPFLRSEDEVAQLQWPSLVEDVLVERQFWDMEFEAMAACTHVPIAKDDFFWALCCAFSRSFTTNFSGRHHLGNVMCPVIDLVNHSPQARPSFVWKEGARAPWAGLGKGSGSRPGGRFELVAQVGTGEGEEVCISYGELSSEELLQNYGFVPVENAYDFFRLYERELWMALPAVWEDPDTLQDRIGVLRYLISNSERAPLAALQTKSFVVAEQRRGGEDVGGGHAFKIQGGGEVEAALMLYARCLVLAKDEVSEIQGVVRKLRDGERISGRNEDLARRLITSVLERQLGSMPTTLEQDKALLAAVSEDDGGGWMSTCLRYRMGRKRMLREAVDALR